MTHEPTFISQMDLGADEATAQEKCFEAARMMAIEGQTGADRKLDDKYDRIQVAMLEGTAEGRIRSDPARAASLIGYVDQVLDSGRRALVGVSVGHRTKTEIPEDRVTGHYVTIYGRGYEADGRVFYRFKDPGTIGEGLATRFADGRFYVDQVTGILFRRGEDPRSKKVPLRDYEVSQVRLYQRDREKRVPDRTTTSHHVGVSPASYHSTLISVFAASAGERRPNIAAQATGR